ncbi:MAG: hypothetical protein HQ472_03905 [Ignavibacteria bacterium]|nr:hypothetical protein [Ignavibacteria bacterium]
MRYFLLVVVLFISMCFVPGTYSQEWTPISAPIDGGELNDIVADNDGILYGNIGLYVVKSTNNGVTWSTLTPKTPLTLADQVADLRVAIISGPGGAKVVTLYPTSGDINFIYVSNDEGVTWNTAPLPTAFQGADIYLSGLKNGGGLAFVRVADTTKAYSSTDGGFTWKTEFQLADMPADIHAYSGGVTFVTDNTFLYRRSIEGAWNKVRLPTVNTSILKICTAGSRLYMIAEDSVYFTTTNGENWTSTTFEAGQTSNYSKKIIGLSDGSAVLFFEYSNDYSAVFHLNGDATAWSTRQDSLQMRFRSPISFGTNNIIFIDRTGPIFSDTQGEQWELRANGIYWIPIWRFVVQGTRIIAVSVSGDVYRGAVDGQTWDHVPTGLRMYGDFPFQDVAAVAPNTFLINTTKGILRSADDGITWSIVSGTEGVRFQGNLSKMRNGNIVVCSEQGLHQSSDQGMSWTKIISDGDTISFRSVVETQDESLLVAAGKGLYRIENNGITLVKQLLHWAHIAVTALSNAQVFGVVGGNENVGLLEMEITLDGGNTWNSSTETFPNGMEPEVFDAVVTDNGRLFVSFGLGFINQSPTGVETIEPFELGSIAIGLRLDGLERPIRSGISIIETGEQTVSVQEVSHPITTTVYPTPSHDVINISGVNSVEPTTIRIVNSLGVVVVDQPVSVMNGIVSLDVHTLPTGPYYAIITPTGQRVSLVIAR